MGRFIVGAIVGAVIGVLFAPRRGEEMREELRTRFNDLYATGSERFPEQTERIQEVISAGRDAATKTSEDIMQAINETRARVIEMVRKEDPEAEIKAEAPVVEDVAEAEAGEAAEETGSK